MRSLALATDLLALDGLAEVERGPDALVLRCPTMPTFWSGNAVLRLSPPEDPEAEEARFRRAFPEALHLSISWDDPALDPAPLCASWAARGAEVGADVVLVRDDPPPPVAPPPGVTLRPLDPDLGADWEESARVALATGVEEGYEPGPHEAFVRARVAGRRAQAAAGRLSWWGAFEGREMRAQMGLVQGVVAGRAVARFQDVDTDPAHRRRGLASALLARVGASARGRLVIVADPEGEAIRLYARAGFREAERVVGVERGAYASRVADVT